MILFFSGYRLAVFSALLIFSLSGCSSPLKQQPELRDEALLKEKIGQMLIVGFDGFEVETDSSIARAIQRRQLGGVILFDYDPTAWSANPAVQGGEERLSGYERLKREWPECVRCVEASPFPHSGW